VRRLRIITLEKIRHEEAYGHRRNALRPRPRRDQMAGAQRVQTARPRGPGPTFTPFFSNSASSFEL
jgi:hypothetical protein